MLTIDNGLNPRFFFSFHCYFLFFLQDHDGEDVMKFQKDGLRTSQECSETETGDEGPPSPVKESRNGSQVRSVLQVPIDRHM